jgi:hypothetical protein
MLAFLASRMIVVGRARICAGLPVGSLSRSSCSWATHQCRLNLGTKQDLVNAPNDAIKLRVAI